MKELCPVCCSSNNIRISSYGEHKFINCRTLKKCIDCELVFASPLPSSEELNEYYSSGVYYDNVSDPFADNILEFSNKLAKTRLELLEEQIGKKGFTTVLDIGAGNASFGQVLLNAFPNAIYDAIEPDIKVSNKWGSWVRNRFSSINSENSEQYKLVILNQVMEHVNNPIEFIITACNFVKKCGFIYIDVPFKDYLFKSSLEPHIIFWNAKSISNLVDKVELQMIFCETAGMTHDQAKHFFKQQKLLEKVLDPWLYANKINHIMNKIGFARPFDTFKQFKADQYGGNRQWLRCIAQKIV